MHGQNYIGYITMGFRVFFWGGEKLKIKIGSLLLQCTYTQSPMTRRLYPVKPPLSLFSFFGGENKK